ncbi:MAG: biotin/lipoyl-binding protein [Bacteroidales bacterium]|nr:biotin/lipoyl-binding protein [Bacteroidales bacterium]
MKITRKKSSHSEYIAAAGKKTKYKIQNPFSEDELKVNGEKKDIKILEDENGFTYIMYKNKKYLTEIVEKNQNKYTVLINGVSYSFTIETPFSYRRKKYLDSQEPKSKTEAIVAPMPGKIIETFCEEGKEIKSGEALLILEAMKMQNEINTPVSGKIMKVHVKANDTVNKDDVLVEIDLK